MGPPPHQNVGFLVLFGNPHAQPPHVWLEQTLTAMCGSLAVCCEKCDLLVTEFRFIKVTHLLF